MTIRTIKQAKEISKRTGKMYVKILKDLPNNGLRRGDIKEVTDRVGDTLYIKPLGMFNTYTVIADTGAYKLL